MAESLKLGLVGADASGRGWGPVAHMPALAAIDSIELAALCTSRPESATAAAEAYGIDRAYHDIRDLAAQPDVDIVSVAVRVPQHHALVMAALDAGKHVYCEWPLGATLAEAEEMATLARAKGVTTAVGLQGHSEPALVYIKELYDEGWLGELLSVSVTMLGGGALAHRSSDAWMGARVNGANTMTIVAGHTLDQVGFCFGSLVEVSGKVAVQVPQWSLTDTGETVDVDAPDNILVNGVLSSGGLLSYYAASVPHHGTGWRLEAYGTKGTLIASTPGLPQITPVTLRGAQHGKPLADLAVPDRFQARPVSPPLGPPGNVARSYQRLADAITSGTSYTPDFDHGVELHRLLDTIERSSDEGRSIAIDPTADTGRT